MIVPVGQTLLTRCCLIQPIRPFSAPTSSSGPVYTHEEAQLRARRGRLAELPLMAPHCAVWCVPKAVEF